jgi:hypothetical protein
MTATLTDNGLPADVNMTAHFTGMDKNGQSHTATLEVKLAFSSFGSTSPRVFDPTGKSKIDDSTYEILSEALEIEMPPETPASATDAPAKSVEIVIEDPEWHVSDAAPLEQAVESPAP